MRRDVDRTQDPGGSRPDRQAEREALKSEIEALKARWPRHSVPPALWEELETLEQRLEELDSM